jgi:hypothetical protein
MSGRDTFAIPMIRGERTYEPLFLLSVGAKHVEVTVRFAAALRSDVA